jgi:hypothetical protein
VSDTPQQPEPEPQPEPGPQPEPELDVFGHAPKGRDDWAHRKGEPRTFALFWMIYLMGASLLMVASIAAVQSVSPGVVRPAARAMLTTATLGLFVLWPMVRLSQKPPKGSKLGAVFADLLVMLPPLAALTLPQALDVLADWPMPVVLAVLLATAGWAVLFACLLALALRTLHHEGGDQWHRVLWMILFTLLVLAPPVYHTLAATPGPTPNPVVAAPGPGSWMSPLSLVTDLITDRSAMGRSAVIGPGHWVLIMRVWAVALAATAAGLAATLARPARGA